MEYINLIYFVVLSALGIVFYYIYRKQNNYIGLLRQKINIYNNQKFFINKMSKGGNGELSDTKTILKDVYDFLNEHYGQLNKMTLISVNPDKKSGKIISVISSTATTYKEGDEIELSSLNCLESLLKKEIFLVNDLDKIHNKSESDKVYYEDGFRSYFCKPLFNTEELVGILIISSSGKNIFTDEMMNSIEELMDSLVSSVSLANEFMFLQTKVDKLDKKSRKSWEMSLAVHKQKEEIEEKMNLVEVEMEKVEKEKQKIKKRNEKLWETSLAVHKEKERIEILKQEIEERHKNITDSISYAKRIQDASLPALEIFKNNFSDFFVFFKPRDVVSGDFYWTYETEDNKIIWAAADCTGHGVPGAFMSMIGISLLNKIVIENKQHSPERILEDLRTGIITALSPKDEFANIPRDGMDLTLCVLDKNSNVLEFSAANNPVWLIRNGEMTAFKAQKQPVGYYEIQEPFIKQTVPLVQGDQIILLTDGYPDQFGGPKGKKYKYKPLQESLIMFSSMPLEKQKDELYNAFQTWKGTYEQTDDVCMIGIKI